MELAVAAMSWSRSAVEGPSRDDADGDPPWSACLRRRAAALGSEANATLPCGRAGLRQRASFNRGAGYKASEMSGRLKGEAAFTAAQVLIRISAAARAMMMWSTKWSAAAGEIAEAVGTGLVLFEFVTTAVVVAQLTCGSAPRAWAVPAGALAAVAGVVAALRATGTLSRRRGAAAMLLLAMTVTMAGAGALWFIDTTWDGQEYHQEAVLQIAAGWNPVVSSLTPAQTPQWRWLNHYALGAELSGCPLVSLSGRIEAMKFFNFTVIGGAFALAFAALLAVGLRGGMALVLAGIAAFNPVSVCQVTGTYVDGRLSSYCVVACAAAVLLMQRMSFMRMVVWATSLALLVMVKFTGVGYAVLAALALAAAAWILRGAARAGAAFAWSVAVVFVAFFLLGSHPYVSNWRSHGHPFYPVRGDGAVDIMSHNSPRSFAARNRLTKLGISLMAETAQADAMNGVEPELKVPFFVSMSELRVARDPDPRMAGWGPLFSGVLLLVVPCGVVLWRRDRRAALRAACLTGAILVCGIANPEAWWARYFPQLSLVPVVVAAGLLSVRAMGAARVWATMLVLSMAVNTSLVGAFHVRAMVGETRAVRAQLEALVARRAVIDVDFGTFRANRRRFDEWGIRWREVQSRDQLKPPVYTVPMSLTAFSVEE